MQNGYFLGGCLFDKVTPDMRIYKEEIFGPVLSVVRRTETKKRCASINEHEFGNGTASSPATAMQRRYFTDNDQESAWSA